MKNSKRFVCWGVAMVCIFALLGTARAAVVISELAYHPVDATNAPMDGDEYEFIEILNTGVAAVAMEGYRLSAGIDFVFPAGVTLASGQRLVVAANPTALVARQGSITGLYGPYTGRLSNGGERVRLRNAFDTTIFSVTYGDQAPWPLGPDGHGSSLILVNPTGDPDEAASWGADAQLYGSPGQANVEWAPSVLIHEVLTHTDPPYEDAIELYNSSALPVDIGGWFLSDDASTREKYEIPPLVLSPGAYVVVYGQDLAGGALPFALSELGDTVYLTSVNGAVLGYADHAQLPVSARNRSFGRYPDPADVLAPWVALDLPTFGVTNPVSVPDFRTGSGSPNAGPYIPPLVVDEIMYNTPSGIADHEYIELYNRSGAPVDLFNAIAPTSTWRVAGGIDYTFPTGVTASVGERILVTAATNEAAFRAHYGISPTVRVFGPWSGRLADSGDTVRIYEPGDPETNMVPQIRLESITYDDKVPWPEAADGLGPSLERLSATAYADSYTNWFAGAAGGSPGAAPSLGLLDPLLLPAVPVPGGVVTASVAVVATSSPTSVVLQVAMGGAPVDIPLNDNGLDGDTIAGDGRYSGSTTLPLLQDWLSYRFRADTTTSLWQWVAVGLPPADPLITEIMYHPKLDGTNGIAEGQGDYVEVYNPAASSRSLDGWRLSGVDFDFPVATTLAPGGYLAVCRDAVAVQTVFGVTNVVGNWLGTLRNGGETLRLLTPYGRQTDVVDFGDKLPWPVVADGYGPSLERLDFSAPATNAANWAASGTNDSWQWVTWSTTPGTHVSLELFLDFVGKCTIDDISVSASGGGSNLVANGNFLAGTNGWEVLGNQLGSRVEPTLGPDGSPALVLVGNLTRLIRFPMILEYGSSPSNVVRTPPLATLGGTTYDVALRVKRHGHGGNLHVKLGAAETTLPLGVNGTPGGANSRSASQPTGLLDVQADGRVLPVGSTNIIRAAVTPGVGMTNLVLSYRTFASQAYRYTAGHYTDLPMRDDGVAPDITATDGWFAVELPSPATNDVFVRYHITAVDANAYTSRWPHVDDPAYDEICWYGSDNVQTTLPNWHLAIDTNPVVYPISARACVASPERDAFSDVLVRHRGRNPVASPPESTGIALRFNRGYELHSWFTGAQSGINFRGRSNTNSLNRVVNEYVAYEVQALLGLPTPRIRHVCLWMNGTPSITMELEDPDESFAADMGLDPLDYLSRVGYTGQKTLSGHESSNNFWTVYSSFTNAPRDELQSRVRTSLAYDEIQYALAVLSYTANFDQSFGWNMFQWRRARDGRWQQAPWDVDMAFNIAFDTTHPYTETVKHPNIWDGKTVRPLANSLFYPETGPDSVYTLPFRYRHQRNLWRLGQTLCTTNRLVKRMEEVRDMIAPAYVQIGATTNKLYWQTADAIEAVNVRDAYLNSTNWSDAMADVWQNTNAYDPRTILINELLIDPLSGGEFIELYNTGPETIDVSWWEVSVGGEIHNIPHGSLIAPGDYLLVTDDFAALTTTWPETSSQEWGVARYEGSGLWDAPLAVWTSATEYATHAVEVSGLTLPRSGGDLYIRDLLGQVVDWMSYTNGDWGGEGNALELAGPLVSGDTNRVWVASRAGSTPGYINTVYADQDNDALPDSWEQQIVTASGGALQLSDIHAVDDYDGDGISNGDEYILGTDPTRFPTDQETMRVQWSGVSTLVFSHASSALPADSDAYHDARLYSLESADDPSGPWSGVPGATNAIGNGASVEFSSTPSDPRRFSRARVWLRPRR